MLAVARHLGVPAEINQVPAHGWLDETLTGRVHERLARIGHAHRGLDPFQGGPDGEPGQLPDDVETGLSLVVGDLPV
jgi:hypothetical protein